MKKAIIRIDGLTAENFTEKMGGYPSKNIIGLSSDDKGQTFQVFVLEESMRLDQKAQVKIPIISDTAGQEGVLIHSIQLLKEGTGALIEISAVNPLTKEILSFTHAVVMAMTKEKIKSSFFPMYSSTRKEIKALNISGVGETHTKEMLLPIFAGAKATRLVKEGKTGQEFLLAKGGELYTVSSTDFSKSVRIFSGRDNILYLGRVQGGKVPVTFENNGVMMYNLKDSKFSKIPVIKEGSLITACIGSSKKGIVAIFGGTGILTLIPSSELAAA